MNYQIKNMLLYGINWALCDNCNKEFEETIKSLKEKEEILRNVWKEKFSYNAIIKRC